MSDKLKEQTPEGNSRSVSSNQIGIHSDLDNVVKKHLANPFRKPIADYIFPILAEIKQKHEAVGGKLILDSACGTGMSTNKLAEKFPDDLVVGIDQSDHRLSKTINQKNNVLFFRADIVDVWLAMSKEAWKIDQHYLFYPNPWPKKKHLIRRWHGHPVFPDLIKISKRIELRSNWKIYVDEFARAVQIATEKTGRIDPVIVQDPVSPFEKKYDQSGQELYSFMIDIQLSPP